MSDTRKIRGGNILARALREKGVDHVFTLAGGFLQSSFRRLCGMSDAGYDDLNPAHVGLFRCPTLDGLRPTELADQHQITKQSINDLLRHLDQSGYLICKIDPAD